MKIRKLIFFLFFLVVPGYAHIGGSGITFEGKAGSYAVMVLINPPDIIPGTATVDVFTTDPDIQSIFVKQVYWFAGDEATPDADPLDPVENERGHFRGISWLMCIGTSGVEIIVTGKKGEGRIIVPVMAVSTAERSMSPSLGWMLFGFCVLLVALLVTIISAGASDALVSPGGDTHAVKRTRTWGTVIAFCVIITLLYGGKMWWDSWAQRYQRFLYRPLNTTASLHQTRNKTVLTLQVDSTVVNSVSRFTRRMTYVVPDHGKLMHMFMVRAGTMDVFAHLHPQRKDSLTFETLLPPLPAGKYWLFADLSWASGFTETLTNTLEVGQDPVTVAFTAGDVAPVKLPDDDTYFQTNPIFTNAITVGADAILCGKPGVKAMTSDGSSIVWEQSATEPLEAGALYSLKFHAQDSAGNSLNLQPYLGMMGHAVVMKDDGSVYIHLHPVGSYSTASQQTMITRMQENGHVDISKFAKPQAFADSIDQYIQRLESLPEEERNNMLMASMPHDETSDPDHPDHAIVTFPYSFPSPGNYRIWIQMKHQGRILNSAFDAVVN
jgi:hypothetical protein